MSSALDNFASRLSGGRDVVNSDSKVVDWIQKVAASGETIPSLRPSSGDALNMRAEVDTSDLCCEDPGLWVAENVSPRDEEAMELAQGLWG